jgi:hypothetical protein
VALNDAQQHAVAHDGHLFQTVLFHTLENSIQTQLRLRPHLVR